MSAADAAKAPPPEAAKPPPPDQVTVDGVARTFRPGESIIQLASRVGVEIPYYCWHPRLSVAANCRMCLVEVEKAPKLAPACQTECRPGMVVHTRNAKVEAARRAVHEFLLVNHPIDCPICDQAGECKLQDYYMKFQATASRMREIKVNKTKFVPLGPQVMYNAERCIVCTRCVRFMDEVAHNRQLGVIGRGDHSVIGTFPGQALDDPYSLNTVDVCPVGALTSRAFRFKQRVWNLRRSPGLCGGCARGCNVHVDQRAGQVYRLQPRENEAVNRSWLCDEGRLTYQRANRPALTEPRQAGGPAFGDADQAVARAVALLKAHVGGAGVGVVLALHATCEEAFVAAELSRALLGGPVWWAGYPDGQGDKLLRVADKNPNRHGIARILAAMGVEGGPADQAAVAARGPGALVVVGDEAAPAALAPLLAAAPTVVQLSAGAEPLVASAQITLPSLTWVQNEGTWANQDGRLQALRPAYPPAGQARPALAWLAALAAGLGQPALAGDLAAVRRRMAAGPDDIAQVAWASLPPEGLPWPAPLARAVGA